MVVGGIEAMIHLASRMVVLRCKGYEAIGQDLPLYRPSSGR